MTLHQQYMADLEASAKTALATVDPTPYFLKYGAVGNMWGAVKGYLDAVGEARPRPSSRSTRACSRPRTCSPRSVAFWLMESMRLDRGYGPQVHP